MVLAEDRFAPAEKVTSTAGIHRAVHKAIVEVYANILNGYPGDMACKFPSRTFTKVNVGVPGALRDDIEKGDVTDGVEITLDEQKGEFKFDFGSEEELGRILNLVEEKEVEKPVVVEEVPVKVTLEDVKLQTKTDEELIPVFKGGDAWTKLVFTNDEVKFAVFPPLLPIHSLIHYVCPTKANH